MQLGLSAPRRCPVFSMKAFPCTQCGLCCQHVHLSKETRFLDSGDGTCKHYSPTAKICTIYAERPDVCRVDQTYVTRFSRLYTWEEFVDMNLQVCGQLESSSKGRP